jgi:hypothetical protein
MWPASAVGIVRGRRVEVGLDGCCLAAGAAAAQQVLMPDLGA